jgi:GH24 family phage-related lysozyme (muramidase)
MKTSRLQSALPLNEELLEQARKEREGLAWWAEHFGSDEPLPKLSETPISDRAFDLIIEFEVTDERTYNQKYRKPTWPGESSGVTIGIGYDVGFATKKELWSDWNIKIPDAMICALEVALGVTGSRAKPFALKLRERVDVPFNAATSVHRGVVIPRWTTLVEQSLSNTNLIGPDCLGALVSLTYNRGASFDKPGDRCREMRALKRHMATESFGLIPNDIRSMKRLWPHTKGLQIRREREATLFEDGLAERRR